MCNLLPNFQIDTTNLRGPDTYGIVITGKDGKQKLLKIMAHESKYTIAKAIKESNIPFEDEKIIHFTTTLCEEVPKAWGKLINVGHHPEWTREYSVSGCYSVFLGKL